jgi:hypothetical protein
VLADTKILLNIDLKDNSNDTLLNGLSRVMKQKVLNYCNLVEIPQALDLTVSEMVAALFKINYGATTTVSIASTGTQAPVAVGVIKSESIGDYSVTYETSSSSKSSTNTSDTESILNDFKGQLNKFRKIRL